MLIFPYSTTWFTACFGKMADHNSFLFFLYSSALLNVSLGEHIISMLKDSHVMIKYILFGFNKQLLPVFPAVVYNCTCKFLEAGIVL